MTQRLILDKDNPLATKVQTRDGREARLICVNRQYGRPIVALIYEPNRHGNPHETIETYYADGFFRLDKSPNDTDLINVPVPPVEHRRWVNWHVDEGRVPYICGTYKSKGDADFCARDRMATRIACVEVVFKEGDGL